MTDTPKPRPDFADIAQRLTDGCKCGSCTAIRRAAEAIGAAIAVTQDANPEDRRDRAYCPPEVPVIVFAAALARLRGASDEALMDMVVHGATLAEDAVATGMENREAMEPEAPDSEPLAGLSPEERTEGMRRLMRALFGDDDAGKVASPQGHKPGNA
jgi:hypothetical protein